MTGAINDTLVVIALHHYFVAIRRKILEIVNVQRTTYAEMAKSHIEQVVEELAEAARNAETIVTDELWDELTTIGGLIMHHIVELRIARQPR